MSGIYIHSTSSIHAILRSGVFLGSTKEMQTTGASAEELGISQDKLHTLFIEWRRGDVAQSVSRIASAKGDIRGVLVFKLPPQLVQNVGGYPAVMGARVDLTTLSLRAVLVAEEDMKATGQTVSSLLSLVRPYVGQTFAFDMQPVNTIKDGRFIHEFLLSALNSGAFF